MGFYPFGELIGVKLVMESPTQYALWSSLFRDDDTIHMYASECEGPRKCHVRYYLSLDGRSFKGKDVVLDDGLTAAPFKYGDEYYLVYVDRQRGNRVRLAKSREPQGPFTDIAVLATPEVFHASDVDLGCNVLVQGPIINIIVSNILPYPRQLYALRFTTRGGLVSVKKLGLGTGLPGPWHSLHNASIYRFDDLYYLVSASNDYSSNPYRGYLNLVVMDRLYDVRGSAKMVILDLTTHSQTIVGRHTVLGADTPSVIRNHDRIHLYFSAVDRLSKSPWNLFMAEYRIVKYSD